MSSDSNPGYWDSYTNLQRVKHELIREYLSGWFPKLSSWSGRILYLDTHAGRGRHKAGQYGSPLVALKTLLTHSFRDRILAKCEVCFVMIENDPDNAKSLETEFLKLGKLHPGISIQISCQDCFNELERLLAELETRRQRIAPAFVFVDPYGFKLPGELLRRLLNAGRVEIFINVMWRELDMAIQQAATRGYPGIADILNRVFAGEGWRFIAGVSPIDARADAAVDVLRDSYGARWATSMRMIGSNGQTRYLLVHFTNHESGRDLMKDCIWDICPDGGFYARRSDNPQQTLLIEPEPDLFLLDEWLMAKLREKPYRWSELSNAIREELWRGPQLSGILRQRRRNGSISASDYEGRFSEKADPIFSLPDRGG